MIRRAQPQLGTLVDITVGATKLPEPRLHDAITLAFAEVALVGRLMSFHAPDSDVARLNRAHPGECLAVHPHTWQVLALAQAIGAACGGAFNIACAPRLVAWGMLPAPAATPPDYVPGVAVVRCEAAPMVRKSAPGWIDLGGIAKGYAVDLAIDALAREGIGAACVNAGGDLRVMGEAPFPVAVRAPHDPRRAGAQLMLHDEAMATSATYFSARTWGGAQVSALVDGRDGQALLGAASVSVRAPRCALADALTKVVLASGEARHPALAKFGAAAFII